MLQSLARSAAALLLLASLTACGSGGETTEPEVQVLTAMITPVATSGNASRGAQVTVPITLTRGRGFTGDVILGATDLPVGVTVREGLITSNSNLGSITFTVGSNAPAVAGKVVSVTARATNVTIASKPYTMTIVAP